EVLALAEVAIDGGRTERQHVLNEAAGRDGHLMPMAQLDEVAHRLPRHEREGAAGELQRVDPRAHRFEDVFEVPAPHRRVVRPSNLGDAALSRFVRSTIERDEIESARL